MGSAPPRRTLRNNLSLKLADCKSQVGHWITCEYNDFQPSSLKKQLTDDELFWDLNDKSDTFKGQLLLKDR